MLLPIGDEPNNPKHVAWMNHALIGMNVAVYLLSLSKGLTGEGFSEQAYGEFVLRWAYNPGDPSAVTLLSSMFMHGGLMHLAGNMLFLWIFGDNVENRLGAFGYLVCYLALGVASTLLFGLYRHGQSIPLIGASGAISGIQGMYFLACPRHKVKLFVWFFIIIITVVKVNARWLMAFWFFMQDVLPIIIGRGPVGDNVAHSAHLGGFAAGFVLMFLIRGLFPAIDNVEDRELHHSRNYVGGHSSRRTYEHRRRGDAYHPRALRDPPPLPRRTPRTPPPLPPPLPPPPGPGA
jgi:membrane associated rhomboid family serine protease